MVVSEFCDPEAFRGIRPRVVFHIPPSSFRKKMRPLEHLDPHSLFYCRDQSATQHRSKAWYNSWYRIVDASSQCVDNRERRSESPDDLFKIGQHRYSAPAILDVGAGKSGLLLAGSV
jgi:hypothetical protein